MSTAGYLIISFHPDRFHIYFGPALSNVQRKIDAMARAEDRSRSFIVRRMFADELGLDFKSDDLLFKIRQVADENGEKPGVLMRNIIEKKLFPR